MQAEKQFSNVDAYIASFPPDIQDLLDDVRSTVRKAAPKAEENIHKGAAAYYFDGEPVLFFSCLKKHIAIFATPETQIEFKDELSDYKQSKGSVKFPFSEPLPLPLITRIVKYKMQRLKEQAQPKTSPVSTAALNATATKKSVPKAAAKTKRVKVKA